MFKKIFSVSFLFVMLFVQRANSEPKFDVKFPLNGDSIASKQLQYDTLGAVFSVSSTYNKRCQSYSVANTKLVHQIKDGSGKDGRYLNGYWREIWTVNRCSKRVDVPILFTLDGKGGAFYSIEASGVKMTN